MQTMGAHPTLLLLCLGMGCLVVYSQSNLPPTGGLSECEQDVGMAVCFMPVFAVLFSQVSAQGQQQNQSGGRSPMSESSYNGLCSAAQSAATCAGGFLSRCAPPEKRADAQLVSRGVTKVLSACSEPDSYSKFNKLDSCQDKLESAAETCSRTAEAGVPESQRLIQSTGPDGMGGIEIGSNPPTQKQICCLVKKFKECIAPSVQSSCTAEEKTVAEKFGERVLRDLECTDAIYQTCG